MKKIIVIAMALALVLGAAAFSEAPVDSVPAVTEEAEAPAASAEVEKVEDDDAALQEALDAYRAAREAKAVSDLEEELKGYVEAGSLTQAQADLILNNVKNKLADKNGVCPNCGYQFQKKGCGQMGGRQGQCPGRQQQGNSMHGHMQRGQMNDRNSQMPDAQSGATPRQGNMQRGQHQMPQTHNR